MVCGLSHLTFVVHDLEKSAELFRIVFDAEEIYHSGDNYFGISREKFLLVCGLWVCLMEGEPLPERTYNHVAFAIPDEEYERCLERIQSLGLEIRPGRPRVPAEGRSIYFYDYDNHLFELHTGDLASRMAWYSEYK